MYDAVTIANEILKIAKRSGRSLTPLQLMKLVYIAHGWALAILGIDLFKDRIEAWKFGPVIPDLYYATKKYGRDHIPHSKINENEEVAIDKEILGFLDDIFKKYGHLSGFALSSLTHKNGTPWHQVYEEDALHIEIPDELIRKHYTEKLDAYRRSAA
ncbi:MAG: type II toxin-antitoxin system antitoxin SocA domain-containing protein [Pseudomonadota bacterium]